MSDSDLSAMSLLFSGWSLDEERPRSSAKGGVAGGSNLICSFDCICNRVNLLKRSSGAGVLELPATEILWWLSCAFLRFVDARGVFGSSL